MLPAETQGSIDVVGDAGRAVLMDGLGDGAWPKEFVDVEESLRAKRAARLGRRFSGSGCSKLLSFMSNCLSFGFGSSASALSLIVILKGALGGFSKATGVEAVSGKVDGMVPKFESASLFVGFKRPRPRSMLSTASLSSLRNEMR